MTDLYILTAPRTLCIMTLTRAHPIAGNQIIRAVAVTGSALLVTKEGAWMDR
jgi:hypothetical protein